MKIHIHLGAHKTATTFIQSQLTDKAARLAEAGIGTVPIARMRREFTQPFETWHRFDPFWFFLVRPYLKSRLDRLIAPHGDKRLILLSDENLAGMLRLNYLRGGYYRTIGQRAKLVSRLLAGHEQHYFFAIRDYPDYLVSAYLQLATRGRAPSFDAFRTRLGPAAPGWADAVADLARAVGPERLTVWTYEWFKDDPQALFDRLAPDSGLTVTEAELAREVLPSLSAKGHAVLTALEPHLSRREFQQMAKMLRAFPFDQPNDKLAITDPDFLAACRSRYQADLAAIRALGVTMLGDEPARPV